MLSIKDFSEFSGVSQTTLRYYDEIGVLPPAMRGKNNYRYYTPMQIIILNFINVLIDLGVPLAKIKDVSEHRTPQIMVELLGTQEDILDARLHELRTAYSILHTYRKSIQTGLLADENFIGVKEMNEVKLVEGPQNDFRDSESFYLAFIAFCNSAEKHRINLRYPIGGVHDSMEGFLQAPSEPHRFYSLDPCGNTTRPGGKYLVGYHRGYYGQFGDLPEKFDKYAKDNGLIYTGPVYSHYLLDEVSVANPHNYLSRVIVRLKASGQDNG